MVRVTIVRENQALFFFVEVCLMCVFDVGLQ